MQEYLGLTGPAAGFMATGDIHRSGATVRFADYIRPGVECELAVRLARDLPPGPCTAEQAADAVGELVAGIEIVENRYGELLELGVPTLIADQVYHAAAVLGEPATQDWRSLDIGTLRGRLLVDGHQRDEGVGADLMGHPMNCLAWLAGSSVAAAFGGLKAGQVVMLGSVTPPVWLTGPAAPRSNFRRSRRCSCGWRDAASKGWVSLRSTHPTSRWTIGVGWVDRSEPIDPQYVYLIGRAPAVSLTSPV